MEVDNVELASASACGVERLYGYGSGGRTGAVKLCIVTGTLLGEPSAGGGDCALKNCDSVTLLPRISKYVGKKVNKD